MISAQNSNDAAANDDGAVGAWARISVTDERPADVPEREALLDQAFGAARFAKTCERLREGRRPARGLTLVARAGPHLVGTLRLWHVAAGGVPALVLGPLAVHGARRSLGIGAMLMREALHRAAGAGHQAILLVGDAPYYARFGFERRFAAALVMPGFVEAERFLGLELVPDALAEASGLVVATGARHLRANRAAVEISRAA